jgi:hypothetical protein
MDKNYLCLGILEYVLKPRVDSGHSTYSKKNILRALKKKLVAQMKRQKKTGLNLDCRNNLLY